MSQQTLPLRKSQSISKMPEANVGASTMSDAKQAITTQIKRLNREALCTFCFGHALNSAVNDVSEKRMFYVMPG